ncbi:Nn.00g045370.m01.CDS01 [Neocucurbitaria sp. VM-36]
MTLLQTLLRATAFKNPLLRTLVPSVALAYGIQTAVAVPSIAVQTERYYDLSGSLTYLSCTALSLVLPYLRARSAGTVTGGLAEYLGSGGLGQGQGVWWWRQVVLSAAVGVWATRLGTYLFSRISSDSGRDSRFDSIRGSPSKFYIAFFAQATWVSLCTLPVILVNSIPRSAYAATSTFSHAISAKPYLTDILGLAIFLFGLTFEVVADRQKSKWVADKKAKKHSEEFLTHGLWAKSRHPNYFGEASLWSGIALASAGLLVRQPALAALGLSGSTMSQVLVTGMCAASPAFVSFLLLKVSGVPLSEDKYDKRYGARKDYQRWKEETPMFVPKFW